MCRLYNNEVPTKFHEMFDSLEVYMDMILVKAIICISPKWKQI